LNDADRVYRGLKVVFMDVTSSTNTRTVISTVFGTWPCGDKVPILISDSHSPQLMLSTSCVLNSFAFDYLVRSRLGGQSLIWSVLEETPFPPKMLANQGTLVQLAMKLALAHAVFARTWLSFQRPTTRGWKHLWAITPHERLRLR